MPQLDLYTFKPQLFAILLGSLFIYLLLVFKILPTLAMTLKIRNNLLFKQEEIVMTFIKFDMLIFVSSLIKEVSFLVEVMIEELCMISKEETIMLVSKIIFVEGLHLQGVSHDLEKEEILNNLKLQLVAIKIKGF